VSVAAAVADTIRIDAPTLDAARSLVLALSEYRTRLLEHDGAWGVEVERDREFNDLLRGVLRATDAYLAGDSGNALKLVVEGRSYALHPPVG
jgi:hypothetical protein